MHVLSYSCNRAANLPSRKSFLPGNSLFNMNSALLQSSVTS